MGFMTRLYQYLFFHSLEQTFNRFLEIVSPRKDIVGYLPPFLIIDVASACNLSCPFCQTKNYRLNQKQNYMTLKTYELLLRKYRVACFIGFCGSGEPLLNPDLFKMVKRAKDERMFVYIVTNGILLKDRIQEILKAKPDVLEISLKETIDIEYKKIVHDKSFTLQSLLSVIRELANRSNRPKIILSYVCSRKRVESIPDVVEVAQDCNADEIVFQNLIPDPLLKNEDQCLFSEDEKWVKSIINKCITGRRKIAIIGPHFYQRDSVLRNCNKPFICMRIGVDGGVSGCPRAIDPNIINGNAITDIDIFNKQHFILLRHQLINMDTEFRYECRFCNERI